MKYDKTTQIEILQTFLIGFFEENLAMPTVQEICDHFGWASKNSAFKKMQLLSDFFIVHTKGKKYTLNPKLFSINVIRKNNYEEDHEKWRKKKESYNK